MLRDYIHIDRYIDTYIDRSIDRQIDRQIDIILRHSLQAEEERRRIEIVKRGEDYNAWRGLACGTEKLHRKPKDTENHT